MSQCEVCGETNHQTLWPHPDFGADLLKCNNCGFIQISFVSGAVLNRYYSDDYRSSQNELGTAQRLQFMLLRARQQADFIQKNGAPLTGLKVLDFGAGYGTLSLFLKEVGAEVTAVEEDKKLQKMIDGINGVSRLESETLFSGDLDGAFDLVTLSHVLEHVYPPSYWIARLSPLLKEGGHLYIEVPNEEEVVEMVGRKPGGRRYGHGHINFFSPKTLSSLCGNFDWLEEKALRVDGNPATDVIGKGVALDFAAIDDPTGKGVYIRSLFQRKPGVPLVEPMSFLPEMAEPLIEKLSRQVFELHARLNEAEKIEKDAATGGKSKFKPGELNQPVESLVDRFSASERHRVAFDVPEHALPALDWLGRHLLPTDTLLVYGDGRETLWWAQHVGFCYSVLSNPEIATWLLMYLSERPDLLKKVRLFLAPAGEYGLKKSSKNGYWSHFSNFLSRSEIECLEQDLAGVRLVEQPSVLVFGEGGTDEAIVRNLMEGPIEEASIVLIKGGEDGFVSWLIEEAATTHGFRRHNFIQQKNIPGESIGGVGITSLLVSKKRQTAPVPGTVPEIPKPTGGDIEKFKQRRDQILVKNNQARGKEE